MNILVANDDGIDARGLRELVEALSQKANVYVSAPHIQRSAAGHGITIDRPIVINEVEFENAKMAIETNGTPADCVKLGIGYFESKKIKIDYVYAGINHGGNLGTDTLYSGTVSAAIEGAMCGKPSAALSVNSHKPEHFQVAKDLAVKTLEAFERNPDIIVTLNINSPNLPKEKIKGVKYTRLGVREYDEWFDPKESKDGHMECFYHGSPIIYRSTDTRIDVIADQEDYASITPLKYDLTNHEMIDEIKNYWRITK